MAEKLEFDELEFEMEEIVDDKKSSKDKKEKTIDGVADLPGVGPSTAKKLSENGFDSLMSVAAASIAQLTAIASLGGKTAQKMIESARGALNLSFVPATEILEERRNMLRITTGAQALDELFSAPWSPALHTQFSTYFTNPTEQFLR